MVGLDDKELVQLPSFLLSFTVHSLFHFVSHNYMHILFDSQIHLQTPVSFLTYHIMHVIYDSVLCEAFHDHWFALRDEMERKAGMDLSYRIPLEKTKHKRSFGMCKGYDQSSHYLP